jgi:hypothetical protein
MSCVEVQSNGHGHEIRNLGRKADLYIDHLERLCEYFPISMMIDNK